MTKLIGRANSWLCIMPLEIGYNYTAGKAAMIPPLEAFRMAEVFVSIKIEPLDEGGYLATSNELQGLIAQGRTAAKTLEIAQDVARRLIESCLEHKDPLPSKIRRAWCRPASALRRFKSL